MEFNSNQPDVEWWKKYQLKKTKKKNSSQLG